MKLPQKTVERLIKYRRHLKNYQYVNSPHIFSHDMARLLNIKPVQVRRDLMLVGFSGNHRKGYHVLDLIALIDRTLNNQENNKVIIVGYGKLGRAVSKYLIETDSHLELSAVFDVDPKKLTQKDSITCFDISKITSIVNSEDVKTAVLAVPPEFAENLAEILVGSGIKGIMNFTGVNLTLPDDIYLKEFDIVTFLEEIAYFIKS